MAGEPNQIKWVGIRPTNPEEALPVKPASAATSFIISGIAGGQNVGIDIKTSSIDLPIKPSSTPYVFQHEPGPWAATRSGITRTQIIKSSVCTVTTAILNTTTAGKIFYLTTAYLHISRASAMEAYIQIRNASDVEVCKVIYLSANTNTGPVVNLSFPMPIAIAAGFDICIVSPGDTAYGGITGWEE